MANDLGKERKFNYAGNEITVSKDLDHFNSLVQVFREEAEQASKLYNEKLKAYGEISKLAEKGEADGIQIFKDIIQRRIVVPAINEYQIFDIDADLFYDNYCKELNSMWHQMFQDSIYDAIVNQYEAYNAKVAERGANVGEYVEGGGFGVGGFLQGAATATAINVVGGMLHGAINKSANEKDRVAINEYLRNVFINFKRSNPIHDFALTLVSINWDFLSDKGLVEANEAFFNDGNFIGLPDKAKAFLNNMKHISAEKVNGAFAQVLLIAPYSRELYREMYTQFGDINGELKKIADYFGVDFLSEPKEIVTVDEAVTSVRTVDKDEEDATRLLATINYDTYYPKAKKTEVLKKLLNIPASKYSTIANVEKKNPKILLLISYCAGWLGIDRMMLGQIVPGVLKFITIGGCMVWWFLDLFKIKGMTEQYNYEKLMPELQRLEKEFGINA